MIPDYNKENWTPPVINTSSLHSSPRRDNKGLLPRDFWDSLNSPDNFTEKSPDALKNRAKIENDITPTQMVGSAREEMRTPQQISRTGLNRRLNFGESPKRSLEAAPDLGRSLKKIKRESDDEALVDSDPTTSDLVHSPLKKVKKESDDEALVDSDPTTTDCVPGTPPSQTISARVTRTFSSFSPDQDSVIFSTQPSSSTLRQRSYISFDNLESGEGVLTYLGPDIFEGTYPIISRGEKVPLKLCHRGQTFLLWVPRPEDRRFPFIIKMLDPSLPKKKMKMLYLENLDAYKQLKEFCEKNRQFSIAKLYNKARTNDYLLIYERIYNNMPSFKNVTNILKDYLLNYCSTEEAPVIDNFARNKLRIDDRGLILISPTFKPIKDDNDLVNRLFNVIKSWIQNDDLSINIQNLGQFFVELDTLKLSPESQSIWDQAKVKLGDLLRS